LYDIEKDPFELNDIGNLAENTDLVKQLSAAILKWMKNVNDPLLEGPLKTPYYEKAIESLMETKVK